MGVAPARLAPHGELRLAGRGLIARLWNVYDAEEPSIRSHVIPDLVQQGRGSEIRLQTDGTERRQFLHAEDCAEGLILQRDSGQPLADLTTGSWIPVGEVTSGTFSPTLRKGVGMALLASQVTDGAEVSVDVRGRREIFTVTKPPFVTPGVRET